MSDNLFKTKSLVEIEECLGKALTELLGRPTKVTIPGIETPEMGFVDARATFTVTAAHEREDTGTPF